MKHEWELSFVTPSEFRTFRLARGAVNRVARTATIIFTTFAVVVGWANLSDAQDRTALTTGGVSEDEFFALPTNALVRPAAPAPNAAVVPSPTKVPLFSGFLEFDWDPDAPGGMPGFGAISESSSTTAMARSKETHLPRQDFSQR